MSFKGDLRPGENASSTGFVFVYITVPAVGDISLWGLLWFLKTVIMKPKSQRKTQSQACVISGLQMFILTHETTFSLMWNVKYHYKRTFTAKGSQVTFLCCCSTSTCKSMAQICLRQECVARVTSCQSWTAASHRVVAEWIFILDFKCL